MKIAVVRKYRGSYRIQFVGTSHEECFQYMRTNKGWSDLIYLNEDGSFGRLSSWIL
jgi:hypothetical protein